MGFDCADILRMPCHDLRSNQRVLRDARRSSRTLRISIGGGRCSGRARSGSSALRKREGGLLSKTPAVEAGTTAVKLGLTRAKKQRDEPAVCRVPRARSRCGRHSATQCASIAPRLFARARPSAAVPSPCFIERALPVVIRSRPLAARSSRAPAAARRPADRSIPRIRSTPSPDASRARTSGVAARRAGRCRRPSTDRPTR